MKLILVIASLWLVGCDPEYRCVDNVVYQKQHGAWIQQWHYKDNKCLPFEKSKGGMP